MSIPNSDTLQHYGRSVAMAAGGLAATLSNAAAAIPAAAGAVGPPSALMQLMLGGAASLMVAPAVARAAAGGRGISGQNEDRLKTAVYGAAGFVFALGLSVSGAVCCPLQRMSDCRASELQRHRPRLCCSLRLVPCKQQAGEDGLMLKTTFCWFTKPELALARRHAVRSERGGVPEPHNQRLRSPPDGGHGGSRRRCHPAFPGLMRLV